MKRREGPASLVIIIVVTIAVGRGSESPWSIRHQLGSVLLIWSGGGDCGGGLGRGGDDTVAKANNNVFGELLETLPRRPCPSYCFR